MGKRRIAYALLGLAVIAFLAGGCVDSGKIKKLESENSQLNQLIQEKDAMINTLTAQSQERQKELDSIKKELDSAKKELGSAKKELDSVNKKPDLLTAVPVAPKK